VTCLCITKDRREWLPKAIRCFQEQTYRNRELLIVADGADVRDLVPADERISLLHIDGPLTIGEKRNFGCERTSCHYIAHWDDDDWSGPQRISEQVERLEASGKAVTGYNSMRFTDGTRWWQYKGPESYALGTSLCYRKDWWRLNQFPALQVGEDNAFVFSARGKGELVSADAAGMMYATVHASNTSPRNMTSNWKEIEC
jgi:glycosyltransferase involved in cell wall biosynthesis